jgi:hypothetical protein
MELSDLSKTGIREFNQIPIIQTTNNQLARILKN